MMYDDTQGYSDDQAAADARKALQDSLDSTGTQGITDPTDKSNDPSNDPAPDPVPAPAPAAPAPAPAATNPTPTNPDGSQVGSGTAWTAGASAPSSAPAGYHWDASMASYEPDAAPAAASTSGPPSGGNLSDPNYAAQFVAYWGNQPGVNPSVKNDPGYWVGRFTSGAFGNDQQYAIARMMQAEGAPEGASTPAPATGQAPTQTAGPVGNTISAASLPGMPSNNQFGDSIRAQLLALLNQAPVDANDPDIAPAIAANKVSSERSLQAENDQIAEAAYAQHLGGSGSTQASMQAARENTGAAEGAFSGNLVAQQALARRAQITQLLQVGAGVMTADQQQQLQAQIAAIDAQLQQESISNQNSQYYSGLDLNANQFDVTANRNAMLDAMGVHL